MRRARTGRKQADRALSHNGFSAPQAATCQQVAHGVVKPRRTITWTCWAGQLTASPSTAHRAHAEPCEFFTIPCLSQDLSGGSARRALYAYTSSASLLWVVFDHYSRAPNARSAAAGPYACTTGNAPPAYHLRQHYACSVPLHSSRPSLTLLRSVALNPATGGGRGVGGWRRGCACLWWITCPASPMRPRDLEHAP